MAAPRCKGSRADLLPTAGAGFCAGGVNVTFTAPPPAVRCAPVGLLRLDFTWFFYKNKAANAVLPRRTPRHNSTVLTEHQQVCRVSRACSLTATCCGKRIATNCRMKADVFSYVKTENRSRSARKKATEVCARTTANTGTSVPPMPSLSGNKSR